MVNRPSKSSQGAAEELPYDEHERELDITLPILAPMPRMPLGTSAAADNTLSEPHFASASERGIVTRAFTKCINRASVFFQILCAPYDPPSVSGVSEPSTPPSDSSPPRDVEFSSGELPWVDFEPRLPDIYDPVDELLPPTPIVKGIWPSALPRSIYTPHGKWAWAADLELKDDQCQLRLSEGNMCAAYIKSGLLGDRRVQYVCKSWAKRTKWHGFFSELALYKCQLKPLQGRVVPAIINVYSMTNHVNVAMEPPHASFWIEASADMPHVLKKRCVDAFQEIHEHGVLHGGVELRHMLIGGDAGVTIVDFQESRALVPNEAVELQKARPEDLRKEMRKVKFKLRYEDSREIEERRIVRQFELERNGTSAVSVNGEKDLDPPIPPTEWNETWIYPGDIEPKRFVLPGQTVAQVEEAVKRFVNLVDQLTKEEGFTATLTPPGTPPPDVGIFEYQGAPVASIKPCSRKLAANRSTPAPQITPHPASDSHGHGYYLRKRKAVTQHSDASPSTKRRRCGDRSPLSRKAAKLKVVKTSTSDTKDLSSANPHPADTPGGSPMEVSNVALFGATTRGFARDISIAIAGTSALIASRTDGISHSKRKVSSEEPPPLEELSSVYNKLEALAAKKVIPRFSPRLRASVVGERCTSEPSCSLDTGPASEESALSGKRKRREDEDPDISRTKHRRADVKVLKWSDRPLVRRTSAGPPLRIRSILKKYNPPAIRLHEMRRIAEEVAEEGDVDVGARQSPPVSIIDLDRINDGTRDLDEELRDDFDMSIDAADSDENFLSGYPRHHSSHENDSADTRCCSNVDSIIHDQELERTTSMSLNEMAYGSSEPSQSPPDTQTLREAHGGHTVIFGQTHTTSELGLEPSAQHPGHKVTELTSAEQHGSSRRHTQRSPITSSFRRWLSSFFRFYR